MTNPAETSEFDATVVIVTYNRKEELRNAVASALAQQGKVEVLVLDDGSDDGTQEMMATEFPHVRYDRGTTNVGYIVHRNRSADLAKGSVLVSIDDDAVFPSTQTVQQTLENFTSDKIGAVAIPYVDIYIDEAVQQVAPDETETWVPNVFRGTAYAVRKDVFVDTGRFREALRHMGEESDYCMRMLNRGFMVRAGTADPIHHLESPKRVRAYILEQASRNWIITALMNYPLGVLPLYLLGHCLMLLKAGFRDRMPFSALRGIMRGFKYGLTHLGKRVPIKGSVFRLFRTLKHQGPLPMEKVVSMLPEELQ